MESVDAMTKYETISTVISIVAIVLTILIPLSQLAWKKWIMIAKVKYYPTGQATLFFTKAGHISASMVFLKLREVPLLLE